MLDLNGLGASTTYTAIEGQDVGGGDSDGELDLAEIAATNPDTMICLAAGCPSRDILVSPVHRVQVKGWRCELMFGEAEVLAPAQALVNGTTIRRETGLSGVEYRHFCFEDHQIVMSSGLSSESFHPHRFGLSAVMRATRVELLELFPELRRGGFSARVPTARMILKTYEARAALM